MANTTTNQTITVSGPGQPQDLQADVRTTTTLDAAGQITCTIVIGLAQLPVPTPGGAPLWTESQVHGALDTMLTDLDTL